MKQNYYLVVKCTPLDDQWEIDAAREPILITTNTDPYDGYGYEIYHINPDGTLTLEKYYEEDYSRNALTAPVTTSRPQISIRTVSLCLSRIGTKPLVNIPMKIQAKKNWKNSGRTRTWGLTPTWVVILMIVERGNEEKFRAGTVIYKDDDGDYVCELWEASTHHPDVVYHMNADGKYKKSGLRSSFLLL